MRPNTRFIDWTQFLWSNSFVVTERIFQCIPFSHVSDLNYVADSLHIRVGLHSGKGQRTASWK
jgi:hypothetical protein